jgi:hypothetical protein
MVQITLMAAIRNALSDLKEIEGDLMANELELCAVLRKKYAESIEAEEEDLLCLDLIKRNIGVRKSHRFDPRKDAKHDITFERIPKETPPNDD